MNGPAKVASYVGIGMLIAGFAVIGLAWNGASERDFIQGQFPYLISGGIGGLGLIFSGMALLLVQHVRSASAEEASRLAALADGMAAVTATLRERGIAQVVNAAIPSTAADEETGQWALRNVVVVGRSSFHDPSCHLVMNREDLDTIDRDAAVAADLAPCRVCKP